MTYTIQIDEAQRALMLRIFHAARSSDALVSALLVERGDAFDTNLAEFETLESMLDDLPDVERETPGTLHGFHL